MFCVGLAIEDTILRVDAIPAQPVKLYAKHRRTVGGGPAATASVAIARLGGRASFAGRAGDDAVGAALRAELEGEGVDVSWYRSFPGFQSPSSVVLVDDSGERLIVAYADPALPAADDWLVPPHLGDALLCDLSWPQGALRCIERALREGIPTVLDADVSRHGRDAVAPLIEAADHVVFSRPGLAQFAGTEEVHAGLKAVARPAHVLVGVTNGEAGFFWLDRDGTLRNRRPPAVKVVDTVGAGDAFHGALALALARRWPLERAIDFANVVAALKCTAPGGRAGLPLADDVYRFDSSFAPA